MPSTDKVGTCEISNAYGRMFVRNYGGESGYNKASTGLETLITLKLPHIKISIPDSNPIDNKYSTVDLHFLLTLIIFLVDALIKKTAWILNCRRKRHIFVETGAAPAPLQDLILETTFVERCPNVHSPN
ncbi:hypothetical protein CEXT_15781 [Caerostris extrusa]|uniref:Uncharacterized protein n=1 Tax=Caerostris extrusa TaxID=172846 RepID=A0AAV4RC64_CAEEX|nr:hypothetical protein CEXT_15781 [Caerostris extrusa]